MDVESWTIKKAAAAKLLQLCPTLCSPRDGSPPGSPVPRIDPPGKNTGVGCHFLLQCMKVKSESEVAQLYLTLCDPMDCSLPGSVHGILQAGVLEWVATAFSERKLSAEELILLNCCVGEDSCESFGLQDPANQSSGNLGFPMNIHWKDWCWSWNSNTLATWCKELTHLKRPWCWERLKTEGEGDDRGWYGWMASPTRWTWVWVMMVMDREAYRATVHGMQRAGHDWATELTWCLLIPNL